MVAGRAERTCLGWLRFAAVFFALLLAALPARADCAAASSDETRRLLAIVAADGDFRMLEVSPDEYALGLTDGAGRTIGVLRLGVLRRRLGDNQALYRFDSPRFTMAISSRSESPGVVETLVRAAHRVADADGGALPDQRPRFPREPPGDLEDATGLMVAAALLLGAWRRGRVIWSVRLPHLLPAAIQLALFGYWSIYWPAVAEHGWSIALQVVMGFALDAAFSFVRFGSWRIGAAPLPIVLSTNLFAWFDATGVVISLAMAFGSKALLRRGASHVLNPSAVGLSCAGVMAVLAPDLVRFGGLFHAMNLAPNMAELVLLLALVPQARFRILPVSIGAALALRAADNPAVLRPPVLLALALLATDPATIPRTDAGRFLFGAFVGATMPALSIAFRHFGYADDFSKVIPIPAANALAPWFDRAGAWVVSRARRGWLSGARPLPNAVFVAGWLALSLAWMGEEKPWSFEPTLHWNLGTPLVVRDGDDVPRCAHNPVFCRPFTFVDEVALWRAQRGGRAGPAP